MRIIGGRWKGRKFHPPAKIPARPTTDFAKEGLFNVLDNYWGFEGLRFLDLFAGTGNITYEFGSRGCEDLTAVEKDPRSARYIRETARRLDMRIRVAQMDVFRFLQRSEEPFDVIFAGPPYPLEHLDEIPDRVFEAETLRDEGWLVLEHNPKHDFQAHGRFLAERKYGTTRFSIFS